VIAPAVVFSAVALVVLVWGAVDGRLRRPDPFRVQALGMLGFGAVALAGLAVDPDLGRYLVAAGWFGHGIWDFVHLKLDKVVARSYALWCGVLDLGIAAELVLKL
jgi:Ni/Fe-hydrogenase subunit HybB-like protein